MMSKSIKHFTIDELCRSYIAEKSGIANHPDDIQLEHLSELLAVLDSICNELTLPIEVTSGFRCSELNKAVGGSKTSAHMCGYAVDLVCKDMSSEELASKIVAVLKEKEIKFDQCIIEKSRKSQWVHFGLKDCKGRQRMQCFSLQA